MIGTLLNNRYRLDAELGRGGMGAVYHGHDTLLDRAVAVKVLSAGMAEDTQGRARLLQEAQAVAKLNHPNIVAVYDAGEAADAPFIVMELVAGQSLHNQRPETLEETLAIIRQICAALAHAHEQGIIHRDVKPENVLITPNGDAKLVDFGLARSIASRRTTEGGITGTVFYMAPEQALGQPLDSRADLYALGVVLYELAAGRLPFEAENPFAVITQHLYAPVVPPRAHAPHLPPALDDLILSLLNKTPEDRPPSAADVLQTLAQLDSAKTAVTVTEDILVLDRIVRGRLVGRERELAAATSHWQQAASGEGQTLLISGEPGIGKTRLVRELATLAEVSGGKTLTGTSYAEGGTPYAAFRQILRDALQDGSENGVKLPAVVLADLLTLEPTLQLRYPNIRPNASPDDIQTEQQRLFESLVVFCTALSNRAPLLLVLEDAHWADSGTLSLLRHLARHTRRQPVLIVVTYREVELDEARPFHGVLLDLDRERLATRLKLTRLSREVTGDMLAALLSEQITADFLNVVYRETEGNPFFVEEVCKALVESGKLYYQDGHWHRPSLGELGIPQSVRIAIQSRVRALPTNAQETLHQAAILGHKFDFNTLAQISDLDEDHLIDALEIAGKAQLIEELSANGGVTFAFAHALIPTTLVKGIRTLQRRRFHRRAASAIENLHPDNFETLAHHYNQAGETKKAITYLLQAGDRARSLYAHQEAIDNYQQALAYLKDTNDLERTARTLMKLGLTYHNAFDFKASRQAYEDGFIFWQRVNETAPSRPPSPATHALKMAVDEPSILDPGLVGDAPSIQIIDQLFSGLAALSPDMSVVPNVAHSWEVLDGGRKYLFRLRDDVYWSDGVPLSAADFEYAWKRVLDPTIGSPGAQLLYDIQGARAYHQGEISDSDQIGVHAVDDTTLAIDLEGLSSYFPHLLTTATTFVVPRHRVQVRGVTWAEPDHIITSGPFHLVAWERGKSMVLERSPTYHGRFSGNLTRVELSFYPQESDEILTSYAADRLDVLDLFRILAVRRGHARQRYAGEYISGPAMTTSFIGFNANRPPLDDQRVRRAFILATDRETLVDVAQKGYQFPATGGFLPLGMPGHSPGISLPYNPQQARRLLAEAGYPNGRGFPTLELWLGNRASAIPTVDYLQAQWQQNLGVKIVYKQMAIATLIAELYKKIPAMWFTSWVADYPDPDNFLRVNTWQEHSGWRHEAYDNLVDEARRVTDQEKRLQMYRQADQILIEEASILPLFYARLHLLVKPWVRKFPTTPIRFWFWILYRTKHLFCTQVW